MLYAQLKFENLPICNSGGNQNTCFLTSGLGFLYFGTVKLGTPNLRFFGLITLIVGCHHTNEEIDGCCSESKLCGYNQGSCASNAECIDGLACVLCDKKSQFPRGTKCCRIVDDDNSIAADSLFVGEGPCNYDWECFGTLICGNIHDTHIDCNSPTIPDNTRCCKRQGFTYVFIGLLGLYILFLINCLIIILLLPCQMSFF